MMKPKDFAKYRLQARPEGQEPSPALLGMNYELDAKSLLQMFPLEDRPTVEEAQRLRDEFAKSFPSLEEELQKLRLKAREEKELKWR